MKNESEMSPDGRHFYCIHENDDGTVDVYLRPDVCPMKTEDGFTDYSITALVVKNVEPWDGLEEDIRKRFHDWCGSAETIIL